jgi:hypothetical protein
MQSIFTDAAKRKTEAQRELIKEFNDKILKAIRKLFWRIMKSTKEH